MSVLVRRVAVAGRPQIVAGMRRAASVVMTVVHVVDPRLPWLLAAPGTLVVAWMLLAIAR